LDGLHLTADLRGCDPAQAPMCDPAALRTLCVEAVAAAGLGAVAELFHRFTPAPGATQSGVTGVVLLAESHLAVHTWPELGAVTLDVYVCNYGADNSDKARQLMATLVRDFAPRELQCQTLHRGQGDSAA